MVWTRIVDNVSSRFAFFPPSPPSYCLDNYGDGEREVYIKPVQRGIRKVSNAKVHLIQSAKGRNGENIVVAFVPAPGPPVKFTVLHSHGNAVDLGQILPMYKQLGQVLRVNFVGYDYRGYGASEGQLAASGALQDISSVMKFIQKEYGLQSEDIVLYGQSVGSGPTTWLAAKTPDVAGVVLHSPFLSGMRVMKPGWTWWPSFVDIFPNFKHVAKIQSRTLILHGKEDAIVGFEHGEKLHASCKNPSEPLWAEGIGHDNLESHPQYIPTLQRFLNECFGQNYGRIAGEPLSRGTLAKVAVLVNSPSSNTPLERFVAEPILATCQLGNSSARVIEPVPQTPPDIIEEIESQLRGALLRLQYTAASLNKLPPESSFQVVAYVAGRKELPVEQWLEEQQPLTAAGIELLIGELIPLKSCKIESAFQLQCYVEAGEKCGMNG